MVDPIVNSSIVSATVEFELDSIDHFGELVINDELVDASIALSPDVRAKVTRVEKGLGFLTSIDMAMVLSFSIGVGASVVANLIYDAIGSGIRRMTLNGRRVGPNREALIDALQTTIDLLKEQQKDTNR